MKLSGYEIANLLEGQDYTIKKYNTKSVWVLVNDRKFELDNLQYQLRDYGCYHDPNINGSSIGALVAGGVKIYLKNLLQQDMMTSENAAMEALQRSLEQAYKESTNIRVILENGTEIVNPQGVFKTKGTPKSDFHLLNQDGDELHISHKKGSEPKHFQQWSGMSEVEISTNRYAQDFQREMNRRYTELKPKDSIAMRIPDDECGRELKLMAVYGVDSANASAPHGPNKVDCLLQGTPSLQKQSDGVYSLTATKHTYAYPELPSGNYDPAMTITYRGDRSNLGIKWARASIYPIGGRKFNEIV